MNSNQYSSLPHSQGGVGIGNRGQPYHNNGSNNGANNGPQNGTQNNKNYKKKNNKKYKNNNNQNPNNKQFNNNVNSQYNSYNSHQDFSCSSLPHSQVSNNYNNNRYSNQYQQSFNKFSTAPSPDLNSFGNNVPVPKQTHTKNNNKHRRGGGANNNYRGTGSFDTDRLNKSLNKENSLDNSFSEIPAGMATSFSLDNIGSISLKNSTAPSKMTNSYSFHNSPSKIKMTEVDTIQEIAETNVNSNFTNIDSGLSSVDSISYSSMPAESTNKNYTPLASDLLSSIEAEEEPTPAVETSSSVSNSSHDSPTQNGYETAISQIASECEISFGYDSMNIENAITNVQIEAEFCKQVESAGLIIDENQVSETSEPTVEVIADKEEDSTTSNISDSSDNVSIKEEAQNPENTIIETTESKVEVPIKVTESPVPEIIVSLAPEESEEPVEAEIASPELIPNIISPACIEAGIIELHEEEDLTQLKLAEQEVNDLVNKIVLDVISQAIQVTPVVEEESVTPYVAETPNFMSLEQEISQLEEKISAECNVDDREISFIDNDNSVVYGKNDFEVIESAEEPIVDTTDAILSKTESILATSNTPEKNTIKNNLVAKEPPVDCFSCTIS